MLEPTPQALAAAVNALYRIRAVEGPPGDDGHKTVWHQCALGAELVSTVDPRGHVVHQELTLIRTHFVWSSERGLATGVVVEEGPKAMANGGQVVELDPQVSPERLGQALNAFTGYAGDDRYLQHILKVMQLTRAGLPTDEEDSVTHVEPLDGPGKAWPARRWLFAAATLAALGAAAAAMLR